MALVCERAGAVGNCGEGRTPDLKLQQARWCGRLCRVVTIFVTMPMKTAQNTLEKRFVGSAAWLCIKKFHKMSRFME